MAEEPADAGYRAFLSYSHKDAAQARWLHRRLESYRLPHRLADRPAQRRLTPIFRDREELPAGQDLSATVRAALAQSHSLIVLCSPHSAASPWVRREVAAFRELHPGRPVLAAIVSGDPPGCFPAGLAQDGAEPLAADLRPARDGRRLGLLKLVAGLSGVGLDALVQRDAQRRVRRVTAITAIALAATLGMAALTVMAIGAQREAQRQRGEAEGLVEFMLTDLRDDLADVGRLDAMAAANERALRYYGSRDDLARLSSESLVRRARVLQAIGDNELARHDFAGALRAFEEARQTTAAQVAGRAGAPDHLLEHSKSLGGIGRVFQELDDWARAQRYYSAAAEAAERLVQAAPNQPDHLGKAASASINLGNVQLYGTEDHAAAGRSYARAVQLLARALRANPGDPHILLSQANAYAYLADSFYARRMWPQSLAARRRQHAIAERLHDADRNNRDIAFRLAAARRGLAHSLRQTGDVEGARARLDQAYRTAVDLTARDPQNARWLKLKTLLMADLGHAAAVPAH